MCAIPDTAFVALGLPLAMLLTANLAQEMSGAAACHHWILFLALLAKPGQRAGSIRPSGGCSCIMLVAVPLTGAVTWPAGGGRQSGCGAASHAGRL